jgi:hypothetical protein
LVEEQQVEMKSFLMINEDGREQNQSIESIPNQKKKMYYERLAGESSAR